MANISHFTQTVNGVSTTYDIHDANAVPRSGGAVITGTAFSKNVDNSEFRIDGGSSWNKGGSVTVYGKDRTDGNGKVVLHAADGSNETYFSFYPDGYIALGSNFSFNTNVTFQIGSSAGIYFQLRYDGMMWSNSTKIYPANNLVMGLGSSTHKWATLNDVDIDNIGFPSTSEIDATGSLTDYTSGQDVVGKYYITTVPGVATGRFSSSTALRFRLLVYKDYNEMANSGDPIFSLPLTESYEWESIPVLAGSCIMIRPESYISPADMGNTGWTLRIYPNKGL